MSAAVYVGTLYAVQLEGQDPIPCDPVALGVDPDLGIVQADTRAELAAGEYMEPPPRARGKKCVRLWYERSRVDFPNERYWFHDLDDCRAYTAATLDKQTRTADRGKEAQPLVILRGPDVEICDGTPGNFLCG